MSQHTEIIQAQNLNETTTRTSKHRLAPESQRRSWSSSSSDEEINEVTQNTIVNQVAHSSNTRIINTNSNIYNGSVVINNIYQQYDNIEQLPAETATVPQDSRLKRFCSALRSTRVQEGCLKKCYIVIPVLLLTVLVLIAFIMWLFNSEQSQMPPSDGAPSSTANNNNLQIISRNRWAAKPPKAAAVSLSSLPPSLVIINHTRTTLCYFLEQCINVVKVIQKDHMNPIHPGFTDIGYNFLVGGDGLVYQGRGWNVTAAHTYGYNSWSIGIGIIGTFQNEEPTKVQLVATQKLIEYGVKNGYIISDYQLFGHRQCKYGYDKPNESPGDALQNVIKTWGHWSNKCPEINVG